MRPESSLLRFALPWRGHATNYLDGELLIPPFGGATSTELRLMTPRSSRGVGAAAAAAAPMLLRTYVHKLVEDQMFYFNTVTRVARYPHIASSKALHLDHCYDCTKEVKTIQGLLARCVCVCVCVFLCSITFKY
jgi:hypothetical protein